jgi:hypothetical protein
MFRSHNRQSAALLVLLAGLILGAPWSGWAQQPRAASSLEAVRARIDLAAPFFVFMDYEDQLGRLGRELTTAVADAVGDDPDLALLRQDFAAILEELGLSGIKAVGMSSTRVRDVGYLNRIFVHAPEPRRGLLAVMGGPARPFATTRLAPPDSDLFFETEIDIPALITALTAVARRFDPEANLDKASKMLSQEAGDEAGAALELAAALRGRITVALRLGQTPTPHPQGLEDWASAFVQKASLLVRMEGIAPKLTPLLRDLPLLAPATVAGRPAFRPVEAIPMLGDNQPVIVVDEDALLIGSSAALVAQSLTRRAGLDEHPAFRQAMSQIGLETGNTLTYASPRLFRLLRSLVASGIESASDQLPNREILPLVEAILAQIPEPPGPIVSVSANLPDGILTHSLEVMSLRGALLALGLYNPEILAPIALAVIPAAIKAEADRRGESRAEEIAERNLALIGEAALGYFAANPGAQQVGYAELAPALAGRLGRVRDVDFTDFQLERNFGKIELELPSGETVVWYAPLTDADRQRVEANLRLFDRAAAWYFRTNPRETFMLGVEAIEDGSPLSALPAPVRSERYEELTIRRTDTEITIDVGAETIAIPRDPALLRQQQQPSPRRPQTRGG